MPNQESSTEETVEEPTAPKKRSIRPIVTKTLIWVGAAVGITAAAVLIGRSTRAQDEVDIYIEEGEPNRLIIEEIPQADEPTE